MTVEHLAYLLMALQVADGLTTYLALKKGAAEGNPIMRKLFEKIGMVPALIITKGALMAIVWHWRDVLGALWLAVFCAVYLAVAVNNVRVARRQRTAAGVKVHHED